MLKVEWQDCEGEYIPEIKISMDLDTALDLVNYILTCSDAVQFNVVKPLEPEFRTDNGINVDFVLIQ